MIMLFKGRDGLLVNRNGLGLRVMDLLKGDVENPAAPRAVGTPLTQAMTFGVNRGPGQECIQ